jgi:hypothetical protein
MDATAANGALPAHRQDASPHGTSKASHYSLGDDDHDGWSAGDASTGDEAARSQSGKRKREKLSVSCETCKQRKVKCDRGHPACEYESSDDMRAVCADPVNLQADGA